jgi:hypothetical protein
MVLFASMTLLQGVSGCRAVEPQKLDVFAPTVSAHPAGGIYRTLPATIALASEADATLFYRWEGGKSSRYTAPLTIPPATTSHRTLFFWAEDSAGNRSAPQREHYVHLPTAPQVEILAQERMELGRSESIVLSWRSTATPGTYELAVTSGDWGPGRRLAAGVVTTAAVQELHVTGTSLFPGNNRLWLRVTNHAGQQAAASQRLTMYDTPAPTRIWPPPGQYGTAQRIALVTQRPATIYYTTDGTEPTRQSGRYMQPFTLDRTAIVRFFSLDPYGNREPTQDAMYTITPQVPSIVLPHLVPLHVTNATPVTLPWQSDMDGRHEVLLERPHSTRRLTISQGDIERDTPQETRLPRNFLTPGDWHVHVRVTSVAGQVGTVTFPIHVAFQDTFADTRYRETEATTAVWDTEHQQVQLAKGPRLLGTYATRGRSRQVTLHGNHAYVANSTGGLHIVDVSIPEQPRRTGLFYPHGKPTALAKHGDTLYMAASGSGVMIFDVARPYRPRPVGMVRVPGSATDILLAPPYAYVGTKQGTLALFDLSAPRRPRLLHTVQTCGNIIDMTLDASRLYLACLDQGVAVLDVTTPSQAHRLHLLPTSSAATGVAVHNHELFVAAGALDIFDLTTPAAPQRRSNRGVRHAYGVAVRPPYVVVAAGPDGIQLVPLERFGTIRRAPTAHYAARLTFGGTRSMVYVADTRGGLRLIDLTQPTAPRPVAALDDLGTIVDVVVENGMAYLANDAQGGGLVVVNLAEATTPHFLAQYHTASTTDVVVHDNWAVVSDAAGILHVVDVRQPNRPTLHATMMLPGKHQRLAMRPPHILVASDEGTIHTIELTPDGMLQHRTTLALPGRATDIALGDTWAYIAAVAGGIHILDLRQPERPKHLASYHHPDGKGDHIIRVTVDGTTLYAIDNVRGIQILARVATGPLRFVAQTSVPTGAPWSVAAVGPYLFVTTLLHSLYVFDIDTPSHPVLLSTSPYGGSALTAKDRLLYIAIRGRRGVPGGLRLVEAFAALPHTMITPLQARGVTVLPGPTPHTHHVPRAFTFQTPGVVVSTVVSSPEITVTQARLRVADFWGTTGSIRYELTNTDGAQWHPVQPGVWWRFPKPGSAVRWRALFTTTDVLQTPTLEQVTIDVRTDPS